jgi:hypothetical protein
MGGGRGMGPGGMGPPMGMPPQMQMQMQMGMPPQHGGPRYPGGGGGGGQQGMQRSPRAGGGREGELEEGLWQGRGCTLRLKQACLHNHRSHAHIPPPASTLCRPLSLVPLQTPRRRRAAARLPCAS